MAALLRMPDENTPWHASNGQPLSAYVFVLNKEPNAMVRGIEISANHLKSVSEGFVYATAKPIHQGRTIQLWEIRVEDEQNELISLCKLSTYTRRK